MNIMLTNLNKVIVQPFPPEEKSVGGIIVPDSYKERSSKAKVIAVGAKVDELKVGYTVWHIKGAGIEVEDKGEKYYIMPETDVLGYLPN